MTEYLWKAVNIAHELAEQNKWRHTVRFYQNKYYVFAIGESIGLGELVYVTI